MLAGDSLTTSSQTPASGDDLAQRAGMEFRPLSVGTGDQRTIVDPLATTAYAADSDMVAELSYGPPNTPPSAAASIAGAGSLLQKNRLVTYYGMDGVPGLGVLGQFRGDELVKVVKERAAAVTAQGGKPALPALHLVVAQAMAAPGSDGTYRRRIDRAVIQRYVDLTAANGMQLILDHQIGNSSLPDEIAALRSFLEHPHVHLALDPEWATPKGIAPGSQMGSLDARDINVVVQELARISQQKGLPNKVLVVHQFRKSMITQRESIVTNSSVDLVINMDGHGTTKEKVDKYNSLLGDIPQVFKGMQIFLRLDATPFTPAQALALNPSPDVIVYL